jgi:hypothetical protein
MAASVTTFDEYVEEGSKLSNFKDMFESLEKLGKGMKNIKGIAGSVANLEFLDTMRDKFAAATSINDKITSGLQKLGLSNKSISLLNRATGGLLSSADPFIMSLYGAAETFASNFLGDLVAAALSNVYIPEEVFILGVKSLAAAKADPNVRNVLRDTTLKHDLALSLEWLDKYNGTKYDIRSPLIQDAITASKNGCFHVAAYILKELKKTYIEINVSPTIDNEGESFKNNELCNYENFFNRVIRHIFVYSYGNLTVDEFRKIIKEFPTFTPSCLGINDEVYSRREMISSSDIEILAPFRRYKTVETIINDTAEDKVFIVPRNKNIKVLYIWLAFSMDYNTTELLVHKNLHDRLKYKMLSTLEKAFYEAQKSLLGSALGRFIFDAKDSYLALIAKYVQETEPYLFDPRNQNSLVSEDRITLPDFREYNSQAAEAGKKDSQDNKLPTPSPLANSGLTYDSFEVRRIDENYSQEQIAREVIDISIKKKLQYMMVKTLDRYPLGIDDTEVSVDSFFIFFNEIFNNLSETEKNTVFSYLLAKYIIDLYIPKGYTLDMIASLYPSLNELGVLSQFSDYYAEACKNNDNTTVPLENIKFSTEVTNNDGNILKIESSDVTVYAPNGAIITSLRNMPGYPEGIDVIGNNICVLVSNNGNPEKDIYYTTDTGLTWIKMNAESGGVLENIKFSTEVTNKDGNTLKIESSEVNIYNSDGSKVASIQNLPGIPKGIDILGNNTYITMYNTADSNSGNIKREIIYYTPDNGLTWINISIESGSTSSNAIGIDRPLDEIPFYKEIIASNGDLIKVEPTGVNIYNTYGEKTGSFIDIQGKPIGIAIVDTDTYVVTVNPKIGNQEVYYSSNNGLVWEKINTDSDVLGSVSIYPGVGITSLSQLNFYEALYYNDIFFKIHEYTISYSHDKINFTNMNLFFDELVLGISTLPSGTSYILTENSLYELNNFSTNSTNLQLRRIGNNDTTYTVIKGVIGTILNSASTIPSTIEDFDIDDKAVIKKLLLYYQSGTLMYYWYNTDSPIAIELFQKNIELLRQKYDETDSITKRTEIQKKIDKQQYYISKMT